MSAVSARAPQGARFVFIERRGGQWVTRMQRIAHAGGLQLSRCINSRCTALDADEDPANLGEIYTELSNPARADSRKPRNSWDIVYSIGVKV